MLFPALAAFFVSGFAALLYQVTWQRVLVIFSGADVYSATTVVAAFMAGLGCGSLAGGYLADRISRFAGLLAFAAAEAAIALFGFNSKALFYDVLYGDLGHLAASSALAAPLLFAVLLVPTSLMGASLPLLARAMTMRVETAARTVGWLYGVNTLGAALGSLAAIWWYMPRHGIEGTLRIAASLNLACAVIVVPLAVIAARDSRAQHARPSPPAITMHAGANSLPFSFWAALYGLSGFIALSLELVWFRLLGVMLKSTALTFGTLLAQYLFWLGLGSAIGSVFAARARRPAIMFLLLQTAAAVYAAIAVNAIVREIGPAVSWAWMREYFGNYEPLPAAAAVEQIVRFAALPGDFIRLYFGLPSLLLAPATLCMGLSFSMLQQVVQTDLRWVGRRTGILLVSNIVGSTIGTMLTGWLLLDVLGTAATLTSVVAVSAVFVFAAWQLAPARGIVKPLTLAAGVLVVLTVALAPSSARLWAALHGTNPTTVVVGEDGSGVSLLKSVSASFTKGVVVFVNGLGQSHLPYGGIHTELGALPALLHPSPKSAAVIGLGSGDTLFGVAGRPDLERIVAIEIIRPQLDTLRHLFLRHPYAGLSTVLGDSRIQHVFGDGRFMLKMEDERFDIIEADALRPTSAYAGNLYSEEYFELLRDRLKPGGYAVTWAPTPRVIRTFVKIFPEVVGFQSILIGSDRPIAIDRLTIEARLAMPRIADYYALAGINIRSTLLPSLNSARRYTSDDPSLRGDTNTDLYPRDEFAR